MHDGCKEGRGATVALTAGTAVSLAPGAVDLIADLDHRTTAQRIEALRGAVRDGSICRASGGEAALTRFGDSSPKPDAFKDK